MSRLESVIALLNVLEEQQRKKMLACANELCPHVTMDDLLQPNDFPVLENHPVFRYEEGVLSGILTVRMAYLAMIAERM